MHHGGAQARINLQILTHLQISESRVLRRSFLLIKIFKLSMAFVQFPKIIHGHRAEKDPVLRGCAWAVLCVGIGLHWDGGVGGWGAELVFVVDVFVDRGIQGFVLFRTWGTLSPKETVELVVVTYRSCSLRIFLMFKLFGFGLNSLLRVPFDVSKGKVLTYSLLKSKFNQFC